MAGHDLARRRDGDEAAAPPAHAGLGTDGVIVRHDEIDGEDALETRACRLHDGDALIRLHAGRHQRGAIGQGPAVILHVLSLIHI